MPEHDPASSSYDSSTQLPTAPPVDIRPFGVRVLAALFLLKKAFAQHPAVPIRIGRQVCILIAPDETWIEPIGVALEQRGTLPLAFDLPLEMEIREALRDGVVLSQVPRRTRRAANHPEKVLIDRLSLGLSVVAVCAAPVQEMGSLLLAAADETVKVDGFTRETLAEFWQALTGKLVDSPAPLPDLGPIRAEQLVAAFREKESWAAFCTRLEKILERRNGTLPSLTLDQLQGLEAAVAWGKDLADDVAAFEAGKIEWSDMDRGALLVGPPGIGKTMFARALAGTCRIPLIIGSLAEWQASGSLDHHLTAMRTCFAEARSSAPSLLFIDEIDAVGSRLESTDRNSVYMSQVITALLQELDGTVAREGVIVLAATNNAAALDPAITRPGRFDHIVELSLPGPEALEGIFRFHLGPDLADADLSEIVGMARDASGADCAKWVRTARRLARKEHRALAVGDLDAVIQKERPLLPESLRWRAAVHEAGHALVAHEYFPDHIHEVSIQPVKGAFGATVLRPPPLMTLSDLEAQIQYHLAGRVAEMLILGEVSVGAGGSINSDLARATTLAHQAFGEFCLDRDAVPLWTNTDDLANPAVVPIAGADIRDKARSLLAKARDSVQALLGAKRQDLERVAKSLERTHRLSRGEFLEALQSTASELRHQENLPPT